MTSDIVAATLAGLGPMIAQGTRKPVDQYAARRAYGLRLLQQGSDTSPVKGGVVEGLARALQAGLGGYLTRRADEGQQAEDETQRSGLMAAIGQAQTSGDFSPVAQALARAGMTGQAASLMLMDSLAKRQAGQGAARVGAILGDGAPGGVPQPGPPGSYPQRVSATESPNGATNPVSGASGFYQMMPRTAVALAKQTAWGASMSPEQILAVVRDPNRRAEQDELMKLYTAQSDATLTQAGIPVSDVSRFALHAFGPAGGVSLLKAPDNMPVDQWVRSVDWGGASPQQVIEQNGLGKYQTVGQLRQDFIARRIGGGNPQVAQGPAPAPVANPPQPPEMPNPGIMPQGAGNDPPMPGVVNPGFNAAPTVPLAPQARVDDGSQDMAIARRLLALPDPQSQAMAMKYLQSAQEKQARAQQFQMDLAGKEPPMLARAGSGIGVVEGAEDAQRRLAAAKATGSAQGGGTYEPATQSGAVGQRNTVTQQFSPGPAGDKLREMDQGAREALAVTSRFMEVFKDRDALNAYIDNPKSPGAQRFLQAYENMKIIMRSPALLNTGVLQGPEIKLLQDALKDPTTFRGFLMTNESMGAKIDELQNLIRTRHRAAFESAGVAPTELPKAAGQGGPAVGAIEDGYRFKGGAPNDPKNWEKVQ